MLAFIEGQTISTAPDHLVVEVGGLGFRVFAPSSQIEGLAAQSPVRLHIHMVVRNDNVSLYGFAGEGELAAFRQLIAVNGIGPRLGLALLSTWDVDQLAQILAKEDVKALTQVSGIGPKTAQRICLELRDKLKPVGTDESVTLLIGAETALTGLGFRSGEVRPILRSLAAECASLEELVRKALARLGGGS